jgi:WD40 repeat protein
MPVAEVHPSLEELTAFTLGTLDEDTQASVESHLETCTSCQERAAVAPGDTLVELLRSTHAQASCGADTGVIAAARVQTPGLVAFAVTDARTPSAPGQSDCPELPEALPPELTRHERYRVVRLLGVGGMGAVYEAEHRVMRRTVALKVIKRAYTASPAALERFRREVRTAARLSHPNIVTTYDAEDAGETHFLVMEYIEGTDLGRLVQERGHRAVDLACDYVRQAALGLQYAFEQGMVHRDLKPHNLMLTPGGCVKILDFGLARFAGEAAMAGATTSGMVLGTVDYIAPEQADNAHEADIRSDIYSLGCTLYYLLAGRPPFPHGTPPQKLMAHVNKTPQPLTELRSDLREGLMSVLQRMMAKDPNRRYQTPAEVAAALGPFVLQGCGRATDLGLTVLLEKTPARFRGRHMFAIAAAILFFLVAGLLGLAVYRIATDKGELVITSESDDVKVVITQGGKVVDIIDAKTDKQIRLVLRSGDYELELKEPTDGLKLNIKNAKLTRGEIVVATITWDDKPVVGTTEPPAAGTPPDGVVACWPANGNAKASLGDNHGTLKGGVTFAPGVAGKAFRLDGATGYVEAPPSDLWGFGRRDFSIELWVQWRALTPSNDISAPSAVFIGCDEGNGPGRGHKWFFGYGDGFLNFHIGNGTKGGFYAKADFSPDLDQWYHLAVTRSRGTFTIYVNGAPVASEKDDIIIPNPDAPLTIGQAEGIGFFSGLIDEVAIYDRALSPDEVKARWSALTPSTKPAAEKVGVVRCFEGHTTKADSVVFFKDCRRFISCGWDGTIRIWDVSTGKELTRLKGHAEGPAKPAINALALSPDERHFLSGGDDGTIRLWDVKTGEQLLTLGENLGVVTDLAFTPDGRWALSGSHDATVRLWDLKERKEVHRFVGHTSPPEGVAISSDGRRAASASWDGTIRLYDLEERKEIDCLRGHTDRVNGVAFSPDGSLLLSCGFDKTLRFWDARTGKELRRAEHPDRVYGVAFSPDGRRALSAGADGTVRLWDVNTAKQVHCFTGHRGAVWCVAFSPDGRSALSCGWDCIIRLWRLPDPPSAKENP